MKKIQRKKNEMRAEAERDKVKRLAERGGGEAEQVGNLLEDSHDEDLLFEDN